VEIFPKNHNGQHFTFTSCSRIFKVSFLSFNTSVGKLCPAAAACLGNKVLLEHSHSLLVSFSSSDKTPDINNIQDERFVLAYGFSTKMGGRIVSGPMAAQYIIEGATWRPGGKERNQKGPDS
jgi:hypothetical protein